MSNDGHATHETSSKYTASQYPFVKLQERFNLYGWRPNQNLSDDENYMVMVLLITRSSKCRQGSMACILTKRPKPLHGDDDLHAEKPLSEAIIGCSINQPIFSEADSDVHAEIGALGQAARCGCSTEGCTAYITMPPCKRCFAALVVSGIKRIVSRVPFSPLLVEASERHGIQVVKVNNELIMERVNEFVKATSQDQHDIQGQRKRRKKEQKERKEKRRLRLENSK